MVNESPAFMASREPRAPIIESLHFRSCRKAVIGYTGLARRAGTKLASLLFLVLSGYANSPHIELHSTFSEQMYQSVSSDAPHKFGFPLDGRRPVVGIS